MMGKCEKCLHRDVCKSCESCCGSVPGCEQFIDRDVLAQKFDELLGMLGQLRKKVAGRNVQSI